MQKLAGNVEHGLDVQVALAFPQLEKVDVLGVAKKPGGLVIERVRASSNSPTRRVTRRLLHWAPRLRQGGTFGCMMAIS